MEGDYRNPPPEGEYKALFEYVHELLKHPPVKLRPDHRRAGGCAMVEKLSELGAEVLAVSLDAIHYHLLARLGEPSGRLTIGAAKRHAYHVLRRAGHPGKLWAKRCRIEPIADRSHQVNTYRYILNHAKTGAWVWSYRQGLYWRERGDLGQGT